VVKPYGDSERYDCILDAGHRLWRVQASEIDFFAAYIIPEETWFILPVELVVSRRTVYFARRGGPRRPDLDAEYRKAWHLLRE
jgi:hypothetical protein